MRSTLSLLLPISMLVLPTFAQNPAPAESSLKFEAASVRPNESGANRGTFGVQPSGRVSIVNGPLRRIIAMAYGIDPFVMRFSLLGGPSELLDSRFDIQAVPPSSHESDQPPRKEDSLLMLRALLADRFGLRMRTETRQVPSFVLTVAKLSTLGPHLRRSEEDCVTVRAKLKADPNSAPPLDFDGKPLCIVPYFSSPKPGIVTLQELGTLDTFIKDAQAFLDRQLIDETGLTGNFEWSVTFSQAQFDPETPPLPLAVQNELGLKMEERPRPAAVYVIDSLAMPTPN